MAGEYVSKEYFDAKFERVEEQFKRIEALIDKSIAVNEKNNAQLKLELTEQMSEQEKRLTGQINQLEYRIVHLESSVNNLTHWNYWTLTIIGLIIAVAPIMKVIAEYLREKLKAGRDANQTQPQINHADGVN